MANFNNDFYVNLDRLSSKYPSSFCCTVKLKVALGDADLSNEPLGDQGVER